jgi:hypothetical protein
VGVAHGFSRMSVKSISTSSKGQFALDDFTRHVVRDVVQVFYVALLFARSLMGGSSLMAGDLLIEKLNRAESSMR